MTEPHADTLPPRDARWYESYRVDATYSLGTFSMTTEEIIAFAMRYDPQPFHLDPTTPGGIIASGWHSICLSMRLIAENYLSSVAALTSPGVNRIRWTKPIYPGEQIDLFATVEATRRSASKPDRGIITTHFSARDPAGDEVMSFEAINFVKLEHP